jgi:branched-chain amino acid transport system substrate-binding protein
MKNVWGKGLFLFLCLVFVVFSSYVSAVPAHAEGKPLTIGLLLPYTGFDPRNAPQMEAATRQRLDEIGWKVGDRKVQLITADEATDPNVGVQKAMKLVQQDKADVILGTLFGNVAIAVAGYCNRVGVPFAPYIEQSYSVIKTAPQGALLPTGTLKGSTYPGGLYAYDKLGFKTASILYSDYVAGEEYIGGFVEGFQKHGGSIVQRQAVPLGTLDFAPFLTNLQKADVVAFWFAGTMGPFLKQFFEFKQGQPVIAPTYWTIEPEIMNELGDKAVGVIGTGHDSPEMNFAKNRQFVEAMKKRLNGETPNHYMYSAYITTATYLEAAKATGGDTSRDKIIKAWRKVKIETPMGVVSFDKDGCGVGDLYVFRFQKEKGNYHWQIVDEGQYKQKPVRAPSE